MLGILLIDMQEGFVIDEREELVETQIKLLDFAKDRKIPIFTLEYFCKGETIKELQTFLEEQNNKIIKKYNDNAFIKMESKYYPYYFYKDLEPEQRCPENKELLKSLKEKKIDKLILTGINKTGCVLKTARGAKKRGYVIYTSEELMNESYSLGHWYYENSNHYKTLKELLNKIC